MNEKDLMKALKKLNDKVYIEHKNKLDELPTRAIPNKDFGGKLDNDASK